MNLEMLLSAALFASNTTYAQAVHSKEKELEVGSVEPYTLAHH